MARGKVRRLLTLLCGLVLVVAFIASIWLSALGVTVAPIVVSVVYTGLISAGAWLLFSSRESDIRVANNDALDEFSDVERAEMKRRQTTWRGLAFFLFGGCAAMIAFVVCDYFFLHLGLSGGS